MQDRDTFQLSYSPNHHTTHIHNRPHEEEEEGLSPNKRSLFEEFKNSILKPATNQEELLSSLTSVQQSEPSRPCSQINEEEEIESETKTNQQSLPTAKQIEAIQLPNAHKIEAEPAKLNIYELFTFHEGRKSALLRRISEAIQFLAQGKQVEKYCYGMEKVEQAVLYFSQDLCFMGLYGVAKQKTDIVSMSSFKGISLGIKTSRFQTYLQKNYVLPEDRCFSLIFEDRSYDFMAKSAEIRNSFVENIKFLRECA